MKIKEGFVLREVCGENVVVAEGLGAIDFGKLISLNKTAAWLWKQAQELGDFSEQTLADRLCETYDVAADVALRDVTKLVGEWKNVGLVEGE